MCSSSPPGLQVVCFLCLFWVTCHAGVGCPQFVTLHGICIFQDWTDFTKSFMQKMAVQTAQSGGARRPRRDEDRAPAAAAAPAYVGDVEGYGNFSRGRDRDSGKGSSYGDTWGGAKGRSGAEGCYNCGEVCSFSCIQPFCANIVI